MNDLRRKTVRNLVIFIVVVVLSGWIGRGIDVLLGEPSNEESLGILIWLVTPLIATIILRTFLGSGWKDVGLRPYFKRNAKWFLVAALIFPTVTSVDLLIGHSFGWIDASGFSFSMFLPLFIGSIVFNFFKNIPEEFVWQGYLTPKLLSLKLKDLYLYLSVGLVWATWHIPYYLYFLDRETFENFTSQSVPVFIVLAFIVMLFWSITFVELRRLTKSVWPLVLLHTLEDAFNLLFIGGFITIAQGKDLIISPVYGVVGIVLHVSIGLTLRHFRKKRDKHSLDA
ncbi:CPBP family glutamic-type intramembrane protease [Haloplasma contractile]|uniref:CAAX amino terminal protease family protein n=1 Tax=Haloplasma contractile SSD-17B TaxID=1033810 RepID=F7Q2H1_9MOLU|nr:CPBP family glutamic-type intramembrane protease [Haloplasma contractile]ERJ11958.1 CAAX amino terminal protease family protein [Haloplasma contractile SSD-17B]